MRLILTLLLALFTTLGAMAAETSTPSLKSTLVLHKIRSYGVDKYLEYYLLAKIPLKQFVADPKSNTVTILGEVILDLRGLPVELQDQIKVGLLKIIAGEYRFPGDVKLDFNKASLEVLDAETDRLAHEKAIAAIHARDKLNFPNAPKTSQRVDHGRAYDDIDVGPGSPGQWNPACSGYLH